MIEVDFSPYDKIIEARDLLWKVMQHPFTDSTAEDFVEMALHALSYAAARQQHVSYLPVSGFVKGLAND